MEDNLVTVAIHTYERAIILKNILESNGIECALHNVNLIQPIVSAGVRVRIRESDLTAALAIIETISFTDVEGVGESKDVPRFVLVPVDFSDYSLKASKFACKVAHSLNASVVLLHTYFSPFYAGGFPVGDAIYFDDQGNDTYKSLIKKNETSMNDLIQTLKKDFSEGILPQVDITAKYREGIPEEQIILYIKKHKPLMLLMGTQGQGSHKLDLLGSVTSEVIDRSSVPVFALPVKTPITGLEDIRSIGFVTQFEHRDMVAFETMMQLLKPFKYKVYFIHMKDGPDTWDEVQLEGLKSYFKRQYPEMESAYVLMNGKHVVENINDFIKDRQIDVLTIASNKRNLVARLFNPSIAKRMVFHSDTPLLVIHS